MLSPCVTVDEKDEDVKRCFQYSTRFFTAIFV